ncbi:MAG TPA: metallopeptidase TldD-related protein [Chloroflexota bacterium]|nr:metallopeptidase TldD-related protein [Chloroflexota bacterium]
MLDLITAALGRNHGVSDWTVRHRRTRSTQLYLIGRAIENVREVNTEEYEVEVFNDHPYPEGTEKAGTPARGVASIKLVPADKGNLARRIEEAVIMAQLVSNPPYTLPEPATYPTLDLADAALANADSTGKTATAFAGELWELVEREAGIRLSAAELFLHDTDLVLENSRGIQTGASLTRVSAEIALLARGQDGTEAEHFRQIEARQLLDLNLSEQVAEAATFARDTLRSTAPNTRLGPVVLSGTALVPLFEAFTFRASARAAYMKLTDTQPGQSVLGGQEVRGDRLNLRSNALRPFAVGSYLFDSEGTPGRDTLLIDNGLLKQRLATQRYAQYLDVPVTGELGNTEVAPGATSLPELLQPGVLHVVGFSAPEVDPVTGDFGSEIRLAYEITPDGPRPVKGGSVTGNVFEAFADARLSQEVEQRGNYHGPQAIRFASLSVSGE